MSELDRVYDKFSELERGVNDRISDLEKEVSDLSNHVMVYHKRLGIVEFRAKEFDDAMRGTLTQKGFMSEVKEGLVGIREEVMKVKDNCAAIQAHRQSLLDKKKDQSYDWKKWGIRFAIGATWAALLLPKLKEVFA